MNDLRPDCTQWPSNEESPDGLCGTPSERFTEAARRVFSVTREQLADAEARAPKTDKPRRAGRQKAKTA